MAAQDLLIVVIALVAAGVWAASNLRGRAAELRAYWARSCSGRAWKRAFPGASKGEIRAFLHLFVDAFAFPRNRALQFLPSDRVLAVYRALYPSSELPDALEVETLAKELGRTYRVSLGELWSEELTLGQLFDRCRVPAA